MSTPVWKRIFKSQIRSRFSLRSSPNDSMGDEVRFATSPDIITDHSPTPISAPYHPDMPHPRPFPETKLRMQVMTNKQGYTELNLSSHNLRDVPEEVTNFTRIQILKLNNNRIQVLPSDISHLRRLNKLYAQHNSIIALPETIINCIHLVEMDLSYNKLSTLPQQFSLLQSLRILGLSDNQFENLPHELGDIESLRQLDLARNNLWHLPYSFQNLNNLRNFNLSHNAFEQLPICVCFMKNLESLDLKGNHLLNLPPDFDKLKYIKDLNLSSNKLETVPYMISNLKGLISLDLSSNTLKSIPQRMARLTKLKVLILQGNKITQIPNNLENVEHMNISENKLKNFSVAQMKNIRHLNANNNELENLPLGVCNLQQLEVLRLNANRISYVSQDIVLLKKLRILDLGNNLLTSLPQVINELENLESFNISGNRIDTKLGKLQMPTPKLGPGKPPQKAPKESLPARKIEEPKSKPSTASEHPRYVSSPRPSRYKDAHDKRRKSRSRSRSQSPHSTHRVHDISDNDSKQSKVENQKNLTLENQRSQTTSPIPETQNLITQRSRGTSPITEYRKSTRSPSPSSRHKAYKSAKTKNKSTQYERSSRSNATQYTPRSSLKRTKPPSQEISFKSNSFPSHLSMQKSRPSIPSSRLPNQQYQLQPDSLLDIHPVSNNTHSISEITYPQTSINDLTMSFVNSPKSYTEHWLEERRKSVPSIHSNEATANETVGDQLSLGEEDFEFQPTTVTDFRLIGLCNEVESMLNQQLLQPIISHRGIFRRSFNEKGTVNTLTNFINDPNKSGSEHVINGTMPFLGNDFPSNKLRDRPYMTNGILRMRADMFKVTPSGGLFRSTVDPGVTVYFPVQAINSDLTLTIQMEKIDEDILSEIKLDDPILENLLSVGHIVHVSLNRNVDFMEAATLTIPAPPDTDHGKLHILTYNEDNSCTPCVTPYKIYQGYISLQGWHFSGRGAIMTKSKCRYKACKAMEYLLQYLYI